MKKFAVLLILGTFLLSVGMVFAQEEPSDSDSDLVTTVVSLPEILLICPNDYVMPAVRAAAELVVEFSEFQNVISIPFGRIVETETGRVLEIGRIELSCESAPEEVVQIDRSPSGELNENLPQPENPEGLAATQTGYLLVNAANANLRSCDDPDCTRVGIVQSSEELIVIGRNEDASWWYVQAGEVRGWIWTDLVIIRGDLTGTAIIETEGEITPPSVYIGYTGNPLYDVLSLQGLTICEVVGGKEYPLIARNGDDTWLWIAADCTDGRTGVEGWISANVVAIRNLGRVFVPIVGIYGPESE